MKKQSPMQLVLGEQWQHLPAALQAHYQYNSNVDVGNLDIHYPLYMKPYFSLLHLFGALINRRGKNVPTRVEKQIEKGIQYWNRSICFPDGKKVLFKSFWVYEGKDEVVEFVNAFLGLRMRAYLKDSELHYEGLSVIVKLGRLLIPIPEWLVLGHTSIVETAISEDEFAMDFKLTHPLLGVVFSYSGKFKTVAK